MFDIYYALHMFLYTQKKEATQSIRRCLYFDKNEWVEEKRESIAETDTKYKQQQKTFLIFAASCFACWCYCCGKVKRIPFW